MSLAGEYFYHAREKHSLVNVVHHFVVAAARVDARNDAGRQTVHQLAQNDAVAQCILERNGRETFTDHSFDPMLSFMLLFWLTLASNLNDRRKKVKRNQYFP